MVAIKKRGKLKITFKNGRVDTWSPDQWDSWDQTLLTVTVRKGDIWGAVYNVADLESVNVE